MAIAAISNPAGAADAVTADPILAKEAADWKAKADIADSKKKLQDATYPKGSVTPLSGGIKAENTALIENKILAYCALKNVTDTIALDLQKHAGTPQKFILLSSGDVTWLQQYRATIYELGNIKAGYDALIKDIKTKPQFHIESVGPAPLIPAVSLLGGIADLLALFRTNETLTGSSFDADEMALVNSLSMSLRTLDAKNMGLVWSSSIGFGVGTSGNLDNSDLVKRMTAINGVKASIAAEIQKMTDAEEAKTSKAKPKPGEKPEQKADSPSAVFKKRFDGLNDLFAGLVGAIRNTDAKSGQIPLVMLLSAEKVGQMIDGGTAAPLAIKVVAMGGNNMTTQNIFFGDHLYQSGGAIVAYQVFNKGGDIVWNNNIPSSTGYVEFKRNAEIGRADKTGFEQFCKK